MLSFEDEAAAARFRADARGRLDGMEPAVRSGIAPSLEADTTDIGTWYSDLVAAIDDALFEASDDAMLLALEELLALAEEAQVAAKYFQRPDALAVVDEIQTALTDSGYVGKSSALPDVVKVVNRELRGGAENHYRIPDSVPAVAQTLLQYQSSHRPQDLWHVVTPDYSSTVI